MTLDQKRGPGSVKYHDRLESRKLIATGLRVGECIEDGNGFFAGERKVFDRF